MLIVRPIASGKIDGVAEPKYIYFIPFLLKFSL
jgi:hypothetical protein